MKTHSGVIYENNDTVAGSLVAPTSANRYAQKFKLPPNYPRGSERNLPNLTGFQIFVETDLDELTVNWSIQHTAERRNEVQQININGSTSSYKLRFRDQETGTIESDATDSEIQTALEELSFLADNISVENLKITFVNRLSNLNVPELEVIDNEDITVTQAIPAYVWSEQNSGTGLVQVIRKNGRAWVDIELEASVTNSSVTEDWRFLFAVNAEPCYSLYTGVDNIKAETETEIPLVASGSNSVAIIHRVLGAVLDESVDFLGNSFRSAATEHLPNSVMGNGTNWWMSKPNPSKFGVEALYFDLRKNGNPSVVNRMTIDALTPGIACNIYYSNDDATNLDSTPESWDELWWNPIPKEIELTAKQELSLPFPVTASFVKLEFTRLQARYYSVGEHQQKIVYKKHPKWVLDHFYQVYLERKESNEIPSQFVTLQYNALDLYYNYFIDDLVNTPFFPALTERNVDTNIFNNYLASITDEEIDQLDPATLSQIKTLAAPYSSHPMASGPSESLLGKYFSKQQMNNYPLESITRSRADTEIVTAKDRDSVRMDQEFPTMSFYVPTRHQYKKSQAKFENDRAYFVGIKQVLFHRDYYASEIDTLVYSETAGDETNLEFNDLVLENGEWTGS
jgi:hypothetical protein